ncbi:hypothetical protein SAMN04488057_11478 [Cyclobacterium lianum]|uniref:DNA topoisomerase IV n=1 Tax=Cyclobacterium lianum TaxID=388280 RepID=A0A1M7Q6C6_9BACT|nr:DNA topoisomerase IV [Cyclobacterium lianum]SHN25925.1 hypothetical protein SAMN04488057_11478 [Cyclobacterium lianum]
MYTRFAKVFYFLSIGLFLFLLLYVYAALPEFATYAVNDLGMPQKQVSRDAFFYISIVFFLIFNLLLVIPAKLIEMKISLTLKRLFPVGDPYRDKILAWIFSFTGILNLASAALVFYVHSLSNQNEISSSEFNFFFYLAPLLLLVWIMVLVFLLTGKMKQVKSGEMLS